MLTFVCLFICSPNSPIYVFNDIHDTNWFITMGRGVLNGLVPYKDLFEQKGPLLYLVYAVCCLFKDINFGIFILEIICNSLFLFVGFKILKHYLSNFYSLIGMMLIAFLTYTSFYRVLGGGAVEEFCLPIIAYILYLFILFLEDKKPLTIFQNLLVGCGLAIIFWTKYSILTAVAPLLIAYFVISLIRKQYKTITFSILLMLGGFLCVSAIPIFYLSVNGAIKDMVHTYFLTNLKANSKNNAVSSFFGYFSYGPLVALLTIVGFVLLVLNKQQKTRWLLPSLFLISLLLLAMQRGFKYYNIQLIPYCVFSLAIILKKLNLKQVELKNLVVSLVAVFTIVGCGLLSYTNENIFKTKKDFPQFVVAEQIKTLSNQLNIENPTLFCYKIWDYGFYTTTNILPSTKYFVQNELTEKDLPEMYESFKDTIENQKVDFVVTSLKVYTSEQEYLTTYYKYCEKYSYYQNDTLLDKKLEFVLLVKNLD